MKVADESGPRGRGWATRAVVLGMMLIALVLAGCGGDDEEAGGGGGGGGAGSFADMDEVTLKVATIYGPDNWQSTPMKAYADAVTKRTQGKIKFDFFYGPALLAPDELAEGLENGIADMAYFVPVYTPAAFPVDDWISKYGFVPDASPVAGTLQAAAATIDWGFNTPEYLDSFEEAGIKAFVPRLQVVHRYKLLCKSPVTTLQQARGKRVRIGGPAWAAEAENLGMTPVTLAGEEIFPGFQRGIVDCFMGGYEDMRALKLIEIGNNVTTTDLTGFTSYAMGMSLNTWESLEPIAQQALWEEIPTYLRKLYENNFSENQALVTEAEERRVEFASPGEEMARQIEQHHENILGDPTKGAPPQVDDAQALVDSYRETHDKWIQIVADELDYPNEAADWPAQFEDDPEANWDLGPWADAIKTRILDQHAPE